MVTRGKLTRLKYRLTSRNLYFSEGLLSTNSQEVPLWAVRDLDLKQSLTQKLRGLGTVVVRVEHSDYTGRDKVELENIEAAAEVRDLIRENALRERRLHDER